MNTASTLQAGISLTEFRALWAGRIEDGSIFVSVERGRDRLVSLALCALLRAKPGDKYYDIIADEYRVYTE